MIRLMLTALATLFTCGQAQAAQQIQRYNFELHCTEPLTGSRWEQPEHEVWRMFYSLEQFRAEHPHSGLLAATLWKIWRDGDFQKREFHHRAFCTLVCEDPALQQPVQDWLAGLDGIQPESIAPQLCDASDPFIEWPAVEIIINGESYSYPADFSPLERDWAASFTRTNYPNQAMFLVHTDKLISDRLGLGELCRVDTEGEGQPIVITTLSESFPLGDIEIPAGMEIYPEFLPAHLVPEDGQELQDFLLGKLRNSISNFIGEPMYGNLFWEQFDYPLTGNAEEQLAAAQDEFTDWLAGYPEFSSGKRFGECSMRLVRDASQRPVQISLRLSHIGNVGRHELLDRFADIGLEPSLRFGNSPPSSGWFGDRQLIADYGFLLRNTDNREIDGTEVQRAVDSYMLARADVLPQLRDESVEIDTRQLAGHADVVRIKLAMPSAFELGRLKDWVSAEIPEIDNWQIDHDVWQHEDPAGPVLINGRSFTYPEDFEGLETRRLASLFSYGVGQMLVGVFAGLDYSPQDESLIPEQFRLGDVCLIERTAEGVEINTVEEHWEHGVDIAALNIPNGGTPDILANYPRWYGEGRDAILEFARERLEGYEVLYYQEEQSKPAISYRSIIANPIPTVEQQALFRGDESEEPTQEEKLATLDSTRKCYDAVLEWMSDNDLDPGMISLEVISNTSDAPVLFNANEMRGFVQQIQIGIADASEEQLIELMDRICLATGMRDVWGRYNGNIYPSVVLDDTVASAGDS
ncbi:MAG: hypothetical protein R3F46_04310 [bacterium]